MVKTLYWLARREREDLCVAENSEKSVFRLSNCWYHLHNWYRSETVWESSVYAQLVGVSGDGIQKSELSKLLVKDERYKKTKECIITGDVLIIDECSMLRRKKFDTVEFVCWYIRGTEQYFGGTQVILSSDSNQFPPVQDHWCWETAEFYFQSNIFFNAIPHCINLSVIFPQKDDDPILCVNEKE